MKHAVSTIWDTVESSSPRHSTGWTFGRQLGDQFSMLSTPYTPGAHAKPFAKHHPATPVTYDAAGTTTPLVTAAPVLDVVA